MYIAAQNFSHPLEKLDINFRHIYSDLQISEVQLRA